MHKIRLLTVSFSAEMQPYEIPAFRGAVIDKVGPKHVLFHNHLEDGYRYKYPTIQYKTIQSHPAIQCINDGVDEIHRYFQQPDWSIHIGDRKVEMKVNQLFLFNFPLEVWDKRVEYQIRDWLALSQENFLKFKQINSEIERLKMLQRILTGNILAFAKGVGWTIDKPIELSITSTPTTKTIPHKGNHLIAFNLTFSTNVSLPNHIGLGKRVSIGYGMIKRKERKNE
ncbi:MAG: hypothetical protein PWR20_1542 [Bacteroidales bacterium]|jgi:hypothetical protein|nr:hypothetical protein [Bacteroidales bacterium]MDN5330538.1 hypothetical protein [Bacteroidales bacterium]NPV36996.1 CRISPR-associated endonuclease Cas6 [Bacteroidales bacterium]